MFYERFFKNAFPLTTQKLGIVYTPIEIVDFMISSTQYLLKTSQLYRFRYWNDAHCSNLASWVCKKPREGEFTTAETTPFPAG